MVGAVDQDTCDDNEIACDVNTGTAGNYGCVWRPATCSLVSQSSGPPYTADWQTALSSGWCPANYTNCRVKWLSDGMSTYNETNWSPIYSTATVKTASIELYGTPPGGGGEQLLSAGYDMTCSGIANFAPPTTPTVSVLHHPTTAVYYGSAYGIQGATGANSPSGHGALLRSSDPDGSDVNYFVEWETAGGLPVTSGWTGAVEEDRWVLTNDVVNQAAGQYRIRSYACDALSCSSWSNWAYFVLTPPAPVINAPACNAAGDRVTFSWGTALGATGYLLRLNSTNYTNAATPVTLAVTPGALNTWGVRSYAYDTGGYSAETAGTFTCTAPPPLTGTCSANRANVIVGQNVAWNTSGVSGGTGSYTYLWSGDEGLSGTNSWANKAYAIAGQKAAQVTVSSPGVANRTINCTNSIGGPTVDVTPSAMPDLVIATDLAPTRTIGMGTATFSVTMRNVGTASAAGSFANIVKVDNDANHATVNTTINAQSYSNVGAGVARTISASHNFATPGTYYVSVCIDSGNTIAESNESNNCGIWQTVTVVTNLPLPSCPSFVVIPSIVQPNQNVTVKWDCVDATSCTETVNSDGFATGGAFQNLAGDQATPTVPAVGRYYEMSCTGPGGTRPGIRSNLFDVVEPTGLITSTPVQIINGGKTRITASCSGALSGSVTWVGNRDICPSSPANAAGQYSCGPFDTDVNGVGTYRLTCVPVGGGDPIIREVRVNFRPIIQPF